jgi:hypothetical protein
MKRWLMPHMFSGHRSRNPAPRASAVRYLPTKLEVHSRADAVTRARELGLLSPSSLQR